MPRLCALVFGVVLCLDVVNSGMPAQSSRMEYRVVFASAKQLARQLDAAGRDGYSCVAVAQPDAGVVAPGVAVVVGRATEGTHTAVPHRAIVAGFMGSDLQAPLERAGSEGFRLCGVTLDESSTNPALVAVMSQGPGAPPPAARYGVEVLTNYKASLARLTAAGRDGFVPIAAAPVNDNRVPEMRSWLVVTERSDSTAAPRDIAVRSGSGPAAVERALNEQGRQGYRVDLAWKEGNDVVAMMSRPAGDGAAPHSFAVESRSSDALHSLGGLYVGDFPYLTSGDRIVISDRSQPASTDVEADPLPKIGALGYADAGALGPIGDHISRHHGFAPSAVRIRRGGNGAFVMATVLGQRAK